MLGINSAFCVEGDPFSDFVSSSVRVRFKINSKSCLAGNTKQRTQEQNKMSGNGKGSTSSTSSSGSASITAKKAAPAAKTVVSRGAFSVPVFPNTPIKEARSAISRSSSSGSATEQSPNAIDRRNTCDTLDDLSVNIVRASFLPAKVPFRSTDEENRNAIVQAVIMPIRKLAESSSPSDQEASRRMENCLSVYAPIEAETQDPSDDAFTLYKSVFTVSSELTKTNANDVAQKLAELAEAHRAQMLQSVILMVI